MSEIIFQQLQADLKKTKPVAGLVMGEILNMPDTLRQFINWLLRNKGANLQEIADYIGEPIDNVQPWVDDMLVRGLIERLSILETEYYRVRTRSTSLPRHRSES